METTSPQPANLVQPARASDDPSLSSELPLALIRELWPIANGESCGLTVDEFTLVLASVGAKHNYGCPPGTEPDAVQMATFLRSLRLADLALASACALGREVGWQRFLILYRATLTQAAIAITGSATLGHDLADSLYSEIYGLDSTRPSPLATYSGRGSLLGWLRTVLAQRHVDHHRHTRRETPLDTMLLDTIDTPAPEPAPTLAPAELAHLTQVIARTLQEQSAEDRFLLCCYFLDRQPLLQIARTLQVHEATISRRIKRLVAAIRKQLLHKLQAGGLSKRAAEEILGADPRDIEINLRTLLQSSQTASFSDKTARVATAASGPS